MTTTRTRTSPVRFEDESYTPGANNKYTAGRVVDAGHTTKLEGDEGKVGDFQEIDADFIVGDDVVDEIASDVDDEEEGEWESEEEDEDVEGEWESEEDGAEEDSEGEGEVSGEE